MNGGFIMSGSKFDRNEMYHNLTDPTPKMVQGLVGLTKEVQEIKEATNGVPFKDLATKEEVKVVSDDVQSRGINIEQFGAVGDGVTDNTQAIEKLNAFFKGKKECHLVLPANKHYVTKRGIAIEGVKNFSIQGDNSTLELVGDDFPSVTADFHLIYMSDASTFRMNGIQTKVTIKDKSKQRTGGLRAYHVWVRSKSIAATSVFISGNTFTDNLGFPNTTDKAYSGTIWIDGDTGGLYGASNNTAYVNKNIFIHDNAFINSVGRVVYLMSAENVHIHDNQFNNQGVIDSTVHSFGGNTISIRMLGVKDLDIHGNTMVGTDADYTGSTVPDYYRAIVLGGGAEDAGVPTVNAKIHNNKFYANNTRMVGIDASVCSDVTVSANNVTFSDKSQSNDTVSFFATRIGTAGNAFAKNILIEGNTIDNSVLRTIWLGNDSTTAHNNITVRDNIFNKGTLSPDQCIVAYTPQFNVVFFVHKNLMLKDWKFDKYFIGSMQKVADNDVDYLKNQGDTDANAMVNFKQDVYSYGTAISNLPQGNSRIEVLPLFSNKDQVAQHYYRYEGNKTKQATRRTTDKGKTWSDWLEYDNVKLDTPRSGTTATRNAANFATTNNLYVGFKYFDTTLGRAVYWDGSKWVDSINEVNTAIKNNTDAIGILGSFTVNIKNYASVATANEGDWGIAINQALSELPNGKGTITIPRGAYVVKTPITLKRGQALAGEGSDSTYLNIQAATGVFVTEQLVTMRDLAVSYGSAEYRYNFTGIDFSASRSYLDNVHILSPKIGIRFNNASYYSIVNSLYIYSADQYGILFERSGGTTPAFDPNNHMIHLKHISGNAKKAGSIGIYIKEGAVNNIFGGEVQSFETNIKIETHNNRLSGLYLEDSVTDLEVTKETNFIDIHSGTIKTTDDADIINMAGGYTKYFDLPPQRPSVQDLKALYLFNEGQGNVLRDYSGNNKDATITGGTWTTGLYGSALQLDSAANEKISVPTNIIDPTKPYTFAILFNTQAVNMYNNFPLFMFDGAKYIRFQRSGDFKTSIYAYDGTAVTQKDLNTSMSTRIGKWAWFFMTYDPASGALTTLDPVNPIETTIANPLTTLTTLDIHRSNGAGNTWVAKYNLAAFWQRKLTRSEARQFINSTQPIVPATAFMRKPRNSGGKIDTTGTAGNTGTVTFATPEADTNYFVSITPTGKSAGAPSGALVESVTKTTTGFTFTLNQAPGDGNTYSFDWMITRS
jgi:hypothetical protein